MKLKMIHTIATWFIAGLIACSPDDPYIPVDPDNKPEPPVTTDYQPIALTTGAAGSFSHADKTIRIELASKNSTYGVCLPQTVSGHFLAEATASKTTNFGLAIVQEKNGKPDFNNYTSVSVCLESGIPTVRVLDRQNGINNVLDNTGTIKKNDFSFRYAVPLANNYFSVPFEASTGKVRIIRNKISGFFHFYVSVGKELNGRFNENWMELAQSKDWGIQGQNYFICPIVRNGNENSSQITYSNIRMEEFSPEDVSDASAGFDVKQRNFTWAGFPGDATVISFDPKHCEAATQNRQFVFWSEMNYVPAWHMNNELLYCYEFAETWSDMQKGCFEPMSDRLLAYTKVDVIENNSVRKVVKFHYALINPDYLAPYPNGVFPEVDEYYTFYPDGIGVRQIDFIQKQEGAGHYRYHELSEPLIISGSSSIAADHVKAPAFTISNLSGNRYDLYPARPFDEVNRDVKNWKEQIYTVHLKNAPDAFSVFSYTSERPEVAPLPLENDLTWHDTNYQMSHWPVDKQPYLNARYNDFDKSNATWPSQVSHSSLIGIEAKGDISWNTAYQMNKDGHKFRTYLMLLGINQPDAMSDIEALTRAWLYTGTIREMEGVEFNPQITGYSKRETVLSAAHTGNCKFTYVPAGRVKNPVFRIDNWNRTGNISVKADGKELVSQENYISEKIGNSLVIWLKKTTSDPITLEIGAVLKKK